MTTAVTIMDKQSPWTGCTVPVVATLADGSVRVRVSELVIIGLEPGEYRPAMSPEDREFAWKHAADWAQGTRYPGEEFTDDAVAYAGWYYHEYVTDAESMRDLPAHSHVWPRYLDSLPA